MKKTVSKDVSHFSPYFLIIKPTRCTNFSILFLEWKYTYLGQFLCPSSEIFLLYTQQWYMSHSFAHNLRAGSGWNWAPSWSSSEAVYKTLWQTPLLCVQWSLPHDRQRNCPKYADFHSKNKSEKLVGFIIRIYHDARSHERKILSLPQQFYPVLTMQNNYVTWSLILKLSRYQKYLCLLNFQNISCWNRFLWIISSYTYKISCYQFPLRLTN
jgi:hypothetical protein